MAIFPKHHKNRVYLRRKSLRMGNYAIGAGMLAALLMVYEVVFNKEEIK